MKTNIGSSALPAPALTSGLILLVASLGASFADAPPSQISGTSVHVVWSEQPAPEALPSGIVKIEGWEHVWYDDADDNRFDGYDIVSISARIDAEGNLLHAGGTFVIRQKLDNYTTEDFLNGAFDPNLVEMGEILWKGVWNLTPNQNGARAVAKSADGLIALYDLDRTTNPLLNLIRIQLIEPREK